MKQFVQLKWLRQMGSGIGRLFQKVFRPNSNKVKQPKEPKEPFSWKQLFTLTLQKRLLISMLLLLIVGVGLVGWFSYQQARETTVSIIEDRLNRETQTTAEMAEYLMRSYVADREKFEKEFEYGVRTQSVELMQDGLEGTFFFVEEGNVTPYNVSRTTSLEIPKSVIKQIESSDKGEGILHSEINGTDYTIAFRFLQEVVGNYLIVIPTEDYMKPINSLAVYITAISSGVVVVAILFITGIVKNITRPLRQVQNAMRTVRGGNLKQNLTVKSNIPEIKSLSRSYNAMIDQMRTMIENIHMTASNLEETGQELEKSSAQTKSGNEQLLSAIDVVKQGAEETVVSSEESQRAFHSMKETLNSLFLHIDTLYHETSSVNERSEGTQAHLNEMYSALQTFNNQFNHMAKTMESLNQHSISIESVTDMIKDIAEQTKLLALNASIEAARSGEAGRGFAVVAEEVGKLAGESSKATKKIGDVISHIRGASEESMKELQGMNGVLETHLTAAEKSTESLEHLSGSIGDMNSKMEEMKEELGAIRSALPQMEEATNKYLSISQESLASAEQMATTSEQQMDQVNAAHEISLQLSTLSDSLNSHVKKFDV